MDAVGSNIRVDARGAQVMRVLPRLNEDVNEEWIRIKPVMQLMGCAASVLTVPMPEDAMVNCIRLAGMKR